jgi:hypothetical protein
MLFLLNDVVLTLDPADAVPPLAAGKFSDLSLNKLSALGAELFTSDPALARNKPERARRLASLIVMKSPEINAALFVAPTVGCRPEQVACRFATLTLDILAGLNVRQQSGILSAADADNAVWRRLAA